MKFSHRLKWRTPPNAIAMALTDLRARAVEFIDLTETNPTRVDLAYPTDEISGAMARGSRAPYRPDPRGLSSAREAVAEQIGADPERVLLTASTSEAYSFLLRLLLDPGDELLTITPGYPLFEHLADLDGAFRNTAPLEFHTRWVLEPSAIAERMTGRTRAVAVVSPNNPTGSYLTGAEQDAVARCCLDAGAALISDEVFADFPVAPPADRAASATLRADVLSFSLGGLSKSAGLPHMKLAWISVGGPSRDVAAALEALELLSDTFLSVATPVQEALPDLLRLAPTIRSSILERVRSNARLLQSACERPGALELLPVEGGWSAVLRVPSIGSDESLVLELLRDQRVLVHPGYFFDFSRDGFVVLSLLPAEPLFREGVARLLGFFERRFR